MLNSSLLFFFFFRLIPVHYDHRYYFDDKSSLAFSKVLQVQVAFLKIFLQLL